MASTVRLFSKKWKKLPESKSPKTYSFMVLDQSLQTPLIWTRLLNLQICHQSATCQDFQAAIDRPAKARKKGYNKAYNYETVAALDWNRGASPLEAWLNQGAVPSTILAAEAQNQGPKDTKISLMAEEVKELKVFRNVHIATTPEPEQSELAVPTVNEMGDLERGARIYYRNITDRYPLLPTYLAHRLAKANHCRAERLRHNQDGDEATRGSMNISPTRSHTSTILRGGGNQPGPASKDVIGRLNETKTTHAQKKYQCKICDKYFTRPSSLRIHT